MLTKTPLIFLEGQLEYIVMSDSKNQKIIFLKEKEDSHLF